MIIGGTPYVFRRDPPRLEPADPEDAASRRPPLDFRDRAVYAVRRERGVRDVNEAY